MTEKRAEELKKQLDVALSVIGDTATGGMISRAEYMQMQDVGRMWNHEIVVGCDCSSDNIRVLDLDWNDVHLLNRKTGERVFEGKYDSSDKDKYGYYNEK